MSYAVGYDFNVNESYVFIKPLNRNRHKTEYIYPSADEDVTTPFSLLGSQEPNLHFSKEL